MTGPKLRLWSCPKGGARHLRRSAADLSVPSRRRRPAEPFRAKAALRLDRRPRQAARSYLQDARCRRLPQWHIEPWKTLFAAHLMLAERRTTQVRAAEALGLTRQVRRLYAAYRAAGAAGLTSRRRGVRSNRGQARRAACQSADDRANAVRGLRPDAGPREAGGAARARAVRRDAAPVDGGGRAPDDAAGAPEACPAATASTRVPRRARSNRRVPARLVRGPRSALHGARLLWTMPRVG